MSHNHLAHEIFQHERFSNLSILLKVLVELVLIEAWGSHHYCLDGFQKFFAAMALFVVRIEMYLQS